MRFFEQFGSAKAKREKQESNADYVRTHQELAEAMKSHNSTLAEVSAAQKEVREGVPAGLQNAREGYATAVARSANLDLLREEAELSARNQLLTMKIDHAGLSPEQHQELQSEINVNVTRIEEIKATVAKAIKDATEGAK